MILKKAHITIRWDTASLSARNRRKKRYSLLLLAVRHYKRLDTSLLFIVTNFHTELKPQVKFNHDMNSPAFTLYTTFVNCKPCCIDQVRLKPQVWIGFLNSFVDLH